MPPIAADSRCSAEIAAVERDGRLGHRASRPRRRDHADDAGQRVAAEDDAVRVAKRFDPLDADQRILREIDAAADVVGGNAVDEHLVEVGVAAADEDRRHAAACARLDERHARYQAQRFEHVRLAEQRERLRIEHRHRRADLRRQDARWPLPSPRRSARAARCGSATSTDHASPSADEHRIGGAGLKARGARFDAIPAFCKSFEREVALSVGRAFLDHLLAGEQLDRRSAHPWRRADRPLFLGWRRYPGPSSCQR